jgi:hypothetical protein
MSDLQYLQETTVWEFSDTPNHTYILNRGGHLVGYIKSGTTKEIVFKSPLKQFSKSRRKFVKLRSA